MLLRPHIRVIRLQPPVINGRRVEFLHRVTFRSHVSRIFYYTVRILYGCLAYTYYIILYYPTYEYTGYDAYFIYTAEEKK